MIPIGTICIIDHSKKVQVTITERVPLFYHYSKNDIKKGKEWLKGLKVKEVDQIVTTYVLITTNETKKDVTSACILQDERKNSSWTLYVTSNPEILDISQHIAKNILHITSMAGYFSYLYTFKYTSIKFEKKRIFS